MVQNFDQLIEAALKIRNKTVVVVYPNNEETMSAIVRASELGLAEFILVGDENAICRLMSGTELTPGRFKVVNEPNMAGALRTSLELIAEGRGDILMKGGIDTSTMMKAVLREEAGIRDQKLLSDIFILEYPQRQTNKFVMITDGGMTLAPDLKNKVELINNAVDVAHALGNPNPKVAVLSATEFVVPSLQSTLDAAALSKMNERGQIKGCVVDGPFGLDNAISADAAAEKRINSSVAGRAEILIAANIESANSLAKSTTFFAGLRLAHVIVGGKVPVLIPSRADKSDAKLLSMALGIIMSEYATKKHVEYHEQFS
ncbi:MAG TPA: bifunctional enoyl-CoA hydratase/phosphate acetyltransferase [Bacteroidota bacterium]|jgi:phosphotransacetylase|nr:bifunctional enoyl-CoA hydratase/phosphate acetyltransferase [Bacteroidota bacterium]